MRYVEKKFNALHHRFSGLQKDWPKITDNIWLQNILFQAPSQREELANVEVATVLRQPIDDFAPDFAHQGPAVFKVDGVVPITVIILLVRLQAGARIQDFYEVACRAVFADAYNKVSA